jgi:hypothetical protein
VSRVRRLVVVLVVLIGSVMISTAPASAATVRGNISTSSADIFWCTSASQSLCTGTTVTSVAGGTPVNLVCWRDDRSPFPNSSPRWFYAYLDNGIEGWLWAPQVGGQSTTPWCNNINWIKVADFAINHLGQVSASSSEASQFSSADWAPGPYGEWSGDCAKFVYLAWNKATATGNAVDIYNYYNARGMVHRYPSRPPRGALVFWNLTSLGHVAISNGNWQAIGTQGVDGQGMQIAQYPVLDSRASAYLGWAMPQSPAVPQNPS